MGFERAADLGHGSDTACRFGHRCFRWECRCLEAHEVVESTEQETDRCVAIRHESIAIGGPCPEASGPSTLDVPNLHVPSCVEESCAMGHVPGTVVSGWKVSERSDSLARRAPSLRTPSDRPSGRKRAHVPCRGDRCLLPPGDHPGPGGSRRPAPPKGRAER
jgi:hypothetical protein